jgi:hypothetical protein
VYTFAEKHDFSGKTVITFSTSGSSGHGQSSEHLAEKAGAGTWKPGKGFSSSVNTAEVKKLLVSDKNKEQSSENAKLLMYRPNDSGETAIKKSKPHTQNSNSN